MNDYDVIIIGGGAAGLMCAFTAGQRGRRVIVLEGSNKPGKKILMSGGGRCNFTHLASEPDDFISGNPDFSISALRRFTPADFIALVESYRIAYHEKSAGQLFCDHSSRDILSMLLTECEHAGVEIIMHADVERVAHEDRFVVSCKPGQLTAESVVLATGGLSIPKMGATDLGYKIAAQFGLAIKPVTAGLVPLTFTGALHELMTRLSGVSLTATASNDTASFTDDILFTHRGLSGPAILQISSYWQPGQSLQLDLLPDQDAQSLLLDARASNPRSLLRSWLSNLLPRALVLELEQMFWIKIAERPLAEISNDALESVAKTLNCWKLQPASTEGYRTAEVTLGGIDTHELSSKTMESKRRPGLFCIGEVVDVTGHLGGYNFQWAWSSGHAAGIAV